MQQETKIESMIARKNLSVTMIEKKALAEINFEPIKTHDRL